MSWATNEGTRRSMLGNKARDTKPELAVRRLLHARLSAARHLAQGQLRLLGA
jgi:hypothetical protein